MALLRSYRGRSLVTGGQPRAAIADNPWPRAETLLEVLTEAEMRDTP
jgi:hypothetical protein